MRDIFLITGATGKVGGVVAQELALMGHEVRGVTRSLDAIERRMPSGVIPVIGDLDQPQTIADALVGVTALFLTTGIGNTAELLALAKATGVQYVMVLSGGIATTGDVKNPIANMLLTEEAAVKNSGMQWTILRPGAFMSNVFGWAAQLKYGNVVRAPFSDLAQAMIDPADIGSVAAAIFTDYHGYAGKTFELTGSERLTNAGRVAVMADVLDRPLIYEPLTIDQARTAMSKSLPAEHVKAFFDFHGDGNVYEPEVSSVVEDVLGRQPHSFREWFTTHSQIFVQDTK